MNQEPKKWVLLLYIAGMTVTAERALRNVKELCGRHLGQEYSLGVIDLRENPELAEKDQILALPTLVREQPLPRRKIIGDLSDTAKVLAALDLLSPVETREKAK